MKRILTVLFGVFSALISCSSSLLAQDEEKRSEKGELPPAFQLHIESAPVFGKQIFIPAKDRGFFGGEKDIKLEVTLYKPAGKGPFPLAILNHGSTGNDRSVAGVTLKWAPMGELLAKERGFTALVPMRRGRGASDGNSENSEPEFNDCNHSMNFEGVNNAVQDLDAVVEFAKKQMFVDMNRIIVMGVSRGGLLSLFYTSKRANLPIKGVVNFVGGWSNYRCAGVNEHLFQEAGKNNKVPSLWIYGRNDLNYPDDFILSYLKAFGQEDGNPIFKFYSDIPIDGHRVARDGKLWIGEVRRFLDQIGFPKK